MYAFINSSERLILDNSSLDVYNMQLSNEPAESLAAFLCSTGDQAFEMCTFVSGGM